MNNELVNRVDEIIGKVIEVAPEYVEQYALGERVSGAAYIIVALICLIPAVYFAVKLFRLGREESKKPKCEKDGKFMCCFYAFSGIATLIAGVAFVTAAAHGTRVIKTYTSPMQITVDHLISKVK